MKKIKKLIVAILAMAMVIGCLAVQASAAESDYIILGTSVGSTWGFNDAATMTDAGNGKYTYEFDATEGDDIQFKIAKKSLVTADGLSSDEQWNLVIGGNKRENGGNFTYEATATKVVITFDSTVTDRGGVSVTGATNKSTTSTSTLNFMGDEGLTGVNWNNGPEGPAANQMALTDGKYTISFDGVAAGTYSYKIIENQADIGWDSVYVYGDKDKYGNGNITIANNNTTVTFSVDATTKAVTVTQTKSATITAEECEELIAAIGTVELSDACKAKIDAAKAKITAYEGNTADISNYATYTAAEAKWNDLVAAGKGDLKLHIKHEWDAAAVYTYGVNDSELHNAGTWPGTFVVNNAKNTGWTDATITLTSAAHVIINNNDGAQTADIKYMASGEYWITVAADKSYTISKEAPAGWVSSSDAEVAANAEALIEAALDLDATKANKDKYDAALAAYNALSADQKKLVAADKVTALNAGIKTIEDIIAKENAGTLTVYVKSPGWTAMNVYGWDGAEFGSWPGKSLTALKANEGWFSVSFDITKATNLIFNDSKKDGGEQTVDWKEVKAGTYWLVLSEKDGEGKYLVDAVSTTAPEGWKEEAAEKIEQELPSTITTVTKEQIDALKDSVKVEGSDDKLVVAPLSATSADVAVITTALSKELKGVKFVAADLKFESNKQPTKDTKITIDVAKFDNIKSAKYVAVYSIDGSKFELVDTVAVKDGKITFTPNHFSTYVFAEASGTSDTPTGVNTAVVIASATLMLAAAVAVIASKKRVTE